MRKDVCKKIQELIAARYDDNHFRAMDIARHFGLSKAGLYRLFKKCELGTPCRSITEYRIAKAIELLKGDPSLKIIDIAIAVGFNDGQYFSTTFKKITGRKPSDLRRN
ncbi:MAG: helix-turn-helix transcriptional regulator [Bacteroidia bacterium]